MRVTVPLHDWEQDTFQNSRRRDQPAPKQMKCTFNHRAHMTQAAYIVGNCHVPLLFQCNLKNKIKIKSERVTVQSITAHLPVWNPNVPGAKQVALSPTVSQTSPCTRKGRRPHEQRHRLRTYQTIELNSSRIDVCTRSSYSSNVRATVMAPPPEMSNDDAPRVTMSSPGRVTMGTPAQSTSPALVCALYLGNFMRGNQTRFGTLSHNGASIISRHVPSSSTCW